MPLTGAFGSIDFHEFSKVVNDAGTRGASVGGSGRRKEGGERELRRAERETREKVGGEREIEGKATDSKNHSKISSHFRTLVNHETTNIKIES